MHSNDSLINVIVHWDNCYFATGLLLEEKAVGRWFLYDKNIRLKENIIFGAPSNCILYFKKMDKRGKTIKEFTALTPCF